MNSDTNRAECICHECQRAFPLTATCKCPFEDCGSTQVGRAEPLRPSMAAQLFQMGVTLGRAQAADLRHPRSLADLLPERAS